MITERAEYQVEVDMPSGMFVSQENSAGAPSRLKLTLRAAATPAAAKQQVRDFVQALRAEVNA